LVASLPLQGWHNGKSRIEVPLVNGQALAFGDEGFSLI
jgi:hypothetical protein